MADLAIVLHGTAGLAEELAARTGATVVTPDRAAEVAAAGAVVGVGAEPWPSFVAPHERVRETVAPAPYYAVQAWHQHPAYLQALSDALARPLEHAPEDTHVLFTAPGPAQEPEPGDVVFLREVAEAISDHLDLKRRSIAWVGGAARPTTETVLATLVEAHERTTVLRCSLDPLGRPDGVHAEASAVGIDLAEVRLSPEVLPGILAEVVATVTGHEGLGGSA